MLLTLKSVEHYIKLGKKLLLLHFRFEKFPIFNHIEDKVLADTNYRLLRNVGCMKEVQSYANIVKILI